MKPYTYLIKHKPTNKVYYGYRSANKVAPLDDLWKEYFTSSTYVKDLINQYGVDSFDFEIRKIFETKEEASSWETKVLRRCKVLTDNKWLNANIAGYIPPTPEVRAKMSLAQRGRITSEETKKKLSEVQKGKPKKSKVYQSVEYKEKMSKIKSGAGNGRYGVPVSEETRRKISEANKGRKSHNKGKKLTPEQAAKRKEMWANNTEARQKISQALKGKPSPLRGRSLSNETKAKISIAQKRYWQSKV